MTDRNPEEDPAAKQHLEDAYGRRKWDTSEYAAKAVQRAKDDEKELKDGKKKDTKVYVPASQRTPLKAREFDVNLQSKLGKVHVVTNQTPTTQQGGFYCPQCDCVIKDSANYLDHINGKKHQRALGMSMRPERATLDQVKSRLEKNKRKIIENTMDSEVFLEERIARAQEEEEKLKQERKERKKQKKNEQKEQQQFLEELKKFEEMSEKTGETEDNTKKDEIEDPPKLDEYKSLGLPLEFSTTKKS